IDIFRFILNNNNNHSTALFGISFCYYTLGIEDEEKWDYENAILYFNQAIDYCLQLLNIIPENNDANNILGLSYYASAGIYININNLTKAIEYLNKAKRLVKGKKEIVLELLAKAYYYNEQNDKAEETIRELSILTGKID